MKLDHCHRASCVQIIEALRAENARLILLEGQHEFNHSRYLNLCRDLAAMTKERDNYKDMISEQWAQPELKAALAENARLREALEKLASVEGNGVARLALALPNDSSALQERLKEEREKIRAEMINEAWSKTGEERSMK